MKFQIIFILISFIADGLSFVSVYPHRLAFNRLHASKKAVSEADINKLRQEVNTIRNRLNKLEQDKNNFKLEPDKNKSKNSGEGNAIPNSLESSLKKLTSRMDKLNSRMGKLEMYERLNFLISCADLGSFQYSSIENSTNLVIEILKYSALGNEFWLPECFNNDDLLAQLKDQLELLLERKVKIEYDDDEDCYCVILNLKKN